MTFKLKKNGNARALPVVRGASLAHRYLNADQWGVICANILDGLTIYQPSQQDLVRLYRVSAQYIGRARKLTPEQRWVVLEYGARHPAISTLPESKLGNGNGELDDTKLFKSIANAGVDRVLSIAARVDQAQRTQR